MTWLPGKVNVVFFIVVSQTYLVAQITVEQISLNLTDDEINTDFISSSSFEEIARYLCEQKDNLQNIITLENLLVSRNQNFKINFSYSVEIEND